MCIEDGSDHFKIDANSGEIRTTTRLSYDSRPSYRVIVIASDQGVPPLQGQAVLNIQVMIRHHHKMWKDVLKVSFDFYTKSEAILNAWILFLESVANICVPFYYHSRNYSNQITFHLNFVRFLTRCYPFSLYGHLCCFVYEEHKVSFLLLFPNIKDLVNFQEKLVCKQMANNKSHSFL